MINTKEELLSQRKYYESMLEQVTNEMTEKANRAEAEFKVKAKLLEAKNQELEGSFFMILLIISFSDENRLLKEDLGKKEAYVERVVKELQLKSLIIKQWRECNNKVKELAALEEERRNDAIDGRGFFRKISYIGIF